MKLKSNYFLKSNKDLARLPKNRGEREREREMTILLILGTKEENITTNPIDTESTIRECYEQLCP